MSQLLAQAVPGPAPSSLPHDIRPLLPYRATLIDRLPWIAAGAVLLALVLLALYLWRKRRQRKPQAPPADPWDVLAAKLHGLSVARPFAGAAMIEFYFQLSLLLREAIERRTAIPATDLTLGELRGPLRKKLPLATDQVELLLAFLERSDLVKFAGFTATADEALAVKSQVSAWALALKPLAVDTAPLAQGAVR